MIEKINEHKPKRHVHFFPQPSRGPFEALPSAQQGAERALLGARFGPFCAQYGLAQKGPEWSRGPKRTGPQSGSPSWPQLPTQLGPIQGPHGNAARVPSNHSRRDDSVLPTSYYSRTTFWRVECRYIECPQTSLGPKE